MAWHGPERNGVARQERRGSDRCDPERLGIAGMARNRESGNGVDWQTGFGQAVTGRARQRSERQEW
jgi:hypothetical protein